MVVKRWIRAKLVADSTLATLAPGGVWEGAADKGTPTPHISFTPVNMGSDIYAIGAIRVMTLFSYQVVGWITGDDFAVLDPIMTRLDALLHHASGTASSGHVLSSVRIDIIDPGANTSPEGRKSRQGGGLYRIEARND